MAFSPGSKTTHSDPLGLFTAVDRQLPVLNSFNNDVDPLIPLPGTETQEAIDRDLSINWELFAATSSWNSEAHHSGTTGLSTYPSDNGSRYLLPADNNAASQFPSPNLDLVVFQYEGTPSPTQVPTNAWHQHPLFGSFVDDLMKSHEKQSAAKRERRKEQNRKAQQAYRERREQRFEVLRHKIEAAEKHCETQFHQIRNLQSDLTRLKDERESLRKQLQSPDLPALTNACGSRLQSGEAQWDHDDDDLLAYGSRRNTTG